MEEEYNELHGMLVAAVERRYALTAIADACTQPWNSHAAAVLYDAVQNALSPAEMEVLYATLDQATGGAAAGEDAAETTVLCELMNTRASLTPVPPTHDVAHADLRKLAEACTNLDWYVHYMRGLGGATQEINQIVNVAARYMSGRQIAEFDSPFDLCAQLRLRIEHVIQSTET